MSKLEGRDGRRDEAQGVKEGDLFEWGWSLFCARRKKNKDGFKIDGERVCVMPEKKKIGDYAGTLLLRIVSVCCMRA